MNQILTNGQTQPRCSIHRGTRKKIVFELTFPNAEGMQFISYLPRCREFFLGELLIKPSEWICANYLPRVGSIVYELLEGEVLFKIGKSREEVLCERGELLTFQGLVFCEIHNQRDEKQARLKVLTVPSFLAT